MTYYPPVGFHFSVEFGIAGPGSSDSKWSEVSGLGQEMQTVSLAEGGLNGYSHKLPTRGNFNTLTLKRGLNVDSTVIIWIKAALDLHKFVPIPVTVSLLNRNHAPLAVWEFVRCYPTKWSVSDLNAMEGTSYVVESLELAYAHHFHINIPGSNSF